MTMSEDVIKEGIASLAKEIACRRTFAIISHPDAGKTTLTEKLLLYGGAIHMAGSVKAKRDQRQATSDWMEMERQRGISVTSSVMQFSYGGCQINLLDTPGHQDFSEDTYRTLVAADSAVMLLDNRKGVEERTRQLFSVCKRRRIPIFTFVNKCDRIGANPLTLLDDIEADLGIVCVPMTWPIVGPTGFVGVYDRRHGMVNLFTGAGDHGASRSAVRSVPLDSSEVRGAVGVVEYDKLCAEIELLDAAVPPFSEESMLAGEMSPMYFGSAISNFGVESFLGDFLRLAPPPTSRQSTKGTVNPDSSEFTGFVFKIQANMDPKHRDRIAFLRICSGTFTVGESVLHVRTGKQIKLSAPQQFMAQERVGIEKAWPGDVIGVLDRGSLRIGDTLSAAGPLEFQDIPRFPPERFARVVPKDPLRRKQLDTGLRELTEEGAAQVFYEDSAIGPAPIVGAVGLLQFDVLQFRLEREYGAPCRFDYISHRYPRWVLGPRSRVIQEAAKRGCMLLYDTKGTPIYLFDDSWKLRSTLQNVNDLVFHEVAP